MQLSRSLLVIADPVIYTRYKAERSVFHKQLLPLITTLLFILAVVIEIVYRGASVAPILTATSVINWLICVLFVILSLAMRKFEQSWPMYLICPLLTLLSFYYYAFHDLERTTAAIYYLILI